jgi:hypothetical protein
MRLNPECERLWAAYLAAERDRVRAVTMPALDAFLDALLAQAPTTWKQWAKDLAREVADEGADWPVRFPLFRRALLPALTEGLTAREHGPARWLASFDQLLNHVMGELPAELRSAEALLKEALRVDPNDHRARRMLVERVAWYLEYTLHELPRGVLFGNDGATADECGELVELLGEFRKDAERLGDTSRYVELIADCDLHFRAYREYLVAGRPGGSYEVFIRARSGR